MTPAKGRLKNQAEKIKKMDLSDLMALFNGWLTLPKDFGQPKRVRLFSPLTNILALSFSSFRC